MKDNLVCPVDHYKPEFTRVWLLRLGSETQESARGKLAIRQVSSLRTQMKADLNVYGRPCHRDGLNDDDRALLIHCGEDPLMRPWTDSRSPLFQRMLRGIAGCPPTPGPSSRENQPSTPTNE